MKKITEGVLALEDFWCAFSSLAPGVSNLNLPPRASLAVGLDSYFGKLTYHSIESESEKEITILCRDCKNCTDNLKDYVCDTHRGVVAGTVEFQTKSKVKVTCLPNTESGLCRMQIVK